MQRRIFLVFGIVSYLGFLAVFAYMAGFVGNFMVPKSIDAPAIAGGSMAVSIGVNLLLLALFAVPHSVMARPGFKRWWTQFVPQAVERSVYVMTSNLLLVVMLAFWRPIDGVIYDLQHPLARAAMWGLFICGWLLVPLATLMINHFDLFGMRQVWLHFRMRVYTGLPFRTPMLYGIIRHPLYLGWMMAFWATPTLTIGHALFAATLTLYMLVVIPLEERDLIAHFGDAYRNYRNRVGALIPRLPGAGVRVDAAVMRDTTWISWLIVIGLLATRFYFNRMEPVIIGIALCAVLAWIDTTRAGNWRAMSVQIRIGYAVLLLAGLLPGMGWIHAVQLVGTSARVLTGYCMLDRELRLMPWNRSGPISMAQAWQVMTAMPGCGGVLRFAGGSETLDSGCRSTAVVTSVFQPRPVATGG